MSTRARRVGGALSLLALLALVTAGLASAGSAPPITKTQPGKVRQVGQSTPTAGVRTVHALGYRLTANLTPTGITSGATGRWDGVLIHTVGIVHPGVMPSIPGCTIVGQAKPGGPGQPTPRASGIPFRVKCNGPVPVVPVPGSGQHWILAWKLTYSHLSSTVSGADLRISVPGAAPAVAATLCTSCTSGKIARTTLSADQANSLLKGDGSVVVRTANFPSGEISGPIVRVPPVPLHR